MQWESDCFNGGDYITIQEEDRWAKTRLDGGRDMGVLVSPVVVAGGAVAFRHDDVVL